MNWPLMSEEELHAFGIQAILDHLQKNEDVTIASVNPDQSKNPQVVGQRWNQLAFIYVRTAMFPKTGKINESEFMHCLKWADQNGAIAFFASVGLACMAYPDRAAVATNEARSLPIRNGGFAVRYEGLVIMSTMNRVKVLGSDGKLHRVDDQEKIP